MLRFVLLAILFILIARAFWRVVDGVLEAAGAPRPRQRQRGADQRPAVRLARDPVCGTHVSPASAYSVSAGGTTHYFCSEQCRNQFRASR